METRMKSTVNATSLELPYPKLMVHINQPKFIILATDVLNAVCMSIGCGWEVGERIEIANKENWKDYRGKVTLEND
jgi:hypothetical protein